jgi:multisubunit Na+/H+ antiporter MnhF subunit
MSPADKLDAGVHGDLLLHLVQSRVRRGAEMSKRVVAQIGMYTGTAMTVSLYDLRIGDHVRLAAGLVAEILSPTEDGKWIRVRYVESAADPELVGTEDLCSEDEIEGRAPTGG